MSQIVTVEPLGVQVIHGEPGGIRFRGVDGRSDATLRALPEDDPLFALLDGVREAERMGELRSARQFRRSMTAVVGVLSMPGVLSEADGEVAPDDLPSRIWSQILEAPMGAKLILKSFKTGPLGKVGKIAVGRPKAREVLAVGLYLGGEILGGIRRAAGEKIRNVGDRLAR